MSNTRFLQKLGQSWYLRVKVPVALQSTVGNTHIRRALHTRDLDEANRLKWAALAQVRAYFDSQRTGTARQLVLPASAPGFAHRLPADPSCDGLRRNGGLDELVAQWAATSDSKTVQFQRRQAYAELRAYLGRNYSPEELRPATAAAYVDTRLLLSPDSMSTRRRKLSALGAFWEWMASRRYVARGANPWRGFRLKDSASAAQKPVKRPYTDTELTLLFSGNPTYPALREVMALGLYTGARINELCSLRRSDLTVGADAAYVRIQRSKTPAGRRTIAVSHPLPLAVLTRRHLAASADSDQIFPELKGGGYDRKLSWHVGQAFRYHRNSRGLDGATDFHSLRRTFVTRLENLGVDQVHIARYVGHSLPTLAFKLYSGGATDATQLATGRAINYSVEIENAVKIFLVGPEQ